MKPPKDQSLYPFCRYILQTVERFIASGDHEFQDEHIPTTINKRRRRNEGVTSEEHAVNIFVLLDVCVHACVFVCSGRRRGAKQILSLCFVLTCYCIRMLDLAEL